MKRPGLRCPARLNCTTAADRTSIVLSVDGGEDSIVDVAPDVASSLSKLHETVLTCTDYATSTVGASFAMQPMVLGQLRDGPPRYRLDLSATLAEWGLDAIPWEVEIIARSCSDAGVATPLLLTIRRG